MQTQKRRRFEIRITYDEDSKIGELLRLYGEKPVSVARRFLHNYAYIMDRTESPSPDGTGTLQLSQLFLQSGNVGYIRATNPPPMEYVVELARQSVLQEQHITSIEQLLNGCSPSQYIKLMESVRLYVSTSN